MLASVPNQQIAADRNKMFNDHNEHMHACLGTHGVFKETKEVFFYHHYYYPALHIFLEFYALFIFDFHISSVCRCFNIFPPHLPMDEAGWLQILYYIHTMLEEPWMKHRLLQGRHPDSAQLAVCPRREIMLCTCSCVHTRRKREKKTEEVARGLA